MAMRTEKIPREDTVDPRQTERRRAAAYLDLWERHVTLTALHSKCPPIPDPQPDD